MKVVLYSSALALMAGLMCSCGGGVVRAPEGRLPFVEFGSLPIGDGRTLAIGSDEPALAGELIGEERLNRVSGKDDRIASVSLLAIKRKSDGGVLGVIQIAPALEQVVDKKWEWSYLCSMEGRVIMSRRVPGCLGEGKRMVVSPDEIAKSNEFLTGGTKGDADALKRICDQSLLRAIY